VLSAVRRSRSENKRGGRCCFEALATGELMLGCCINSCLKNLLEDTRTVHYDAFGLLVGVWVRRFFLLRSAFETAGHGRALVTE